MSVSEITLPLSGEYGGEAVGVSYLANLPNHTGASGIEVVVWCPWGHASFDFWRYHE